MGKTTTVYADDHKFESVEVYSDKCKHCDSSRVKHCQYTHEESKRLMQGDSPTHALPRELDAAQAATPLQGIVHYRVITGRFKVYNAEGEQIATADSETDAGRIVAALRAVNNFDAMREALFDVIDAGDPERGGDPWAFDESQIELFGLGLSAFDIETMVTENRWRFVDAVVGKLTGEMQTAVNAEVKG